MIDFMTRRKWKANPVVTGELWDGPASSSLGVDHSLKKEELAILNSWYDMSKFPRIEGMNMEALGHSLSVRALQASTDMSPRPTIVSIFLSGLHVNWSLICWEDQKGATDPPRQGFGSFLMHHCNAIADKTGGSTWVTVVQAMRFQRCGDKFWSKY